MQPEKILWKLATADPHDWRSTPLKRQDRPEQSWKRELSEWTTFLVIRDYRPDKSMQYSSLIFASREELAIDWLIEVSDTLRFRGSPVFKVNLTKIIYLQKCYLTQAACYFVDLLFLWDNATLEDCAVSRHWRGSPPLPIPPPPVPFATTAITSQVKI